jgi:4-amino-4-deoxy-L-arabinose transferase-like glycosyltransferase
MEQKMKNIDLVKGFKVMLLLISMLFIFFGYEIGNRTFADPDEGRYVEIAREMVVNSDYITPKLNGLKYFEKPALFYWLQAVSIKMFGINEISMRLWVLFFSVIGCLMLFLVGYYCESLEVGIASAGILATTLLYYAISRLIILDMALTIFMSGSLWCFFVAFVKKNSIFSSRKYIVVLMYVLSAMACLTKGLIGIILPGSVAFLWIIFTKNWKEIRKIINIPGVIAFLLIFLPWHIVVCLRNNDFFYSYFIYEHFIRYATTAHGRYQPVWFFLPVLIGGLLPWSGFSLVAIADSIKSAFCKSTAIGDATSENKSENIFLLSWIFGILFFFSLSSSKLIPYILPIFPPIAYLTASALVKENCNGKIFKTGVLINVTLFLVSIGAFFVARHQVDSILKEMDVITLVSVFFFLWILFSIITVLRACSKLKTVYIFPLLLFLSANMLWVINKASCYYQDEKKPSTKQLAKTIKYNRRDGDLVFCYEYYYQDFPVYLESTVGVVGGLGELSVCKDIDAASDRLLTEKQFWGLWKTFPKRIFLLLPRDDYRKIFATIIKITTHKILEFDKYFIVITNK